MTRLRILEGEVDRVKGRDVTREVDPTDDLRCLAILRDEVKEQRLGGDWRDYRIQALHQRRGWITYRAR